MAKSGNKQNIVLVVIAFFVIALSILVTLYFSGLWSSPPKEGYKNVTFTDAVLRCEDKTRRHFGKKLKLFFVDDHSSRYDANAYMYKIFLEAFVQKSKKRVQFFVNCYVSAERGRIKKFETFEQVDGKKGEAKTKDSDKLMIWPE